MSGAREEPDADELEPQLVEALEMIRQQPANTDFRASLREQFVSGEFELPEELRGALDAWDVTPASAELRARLREQFVEGRFEAGSTGGPVAASAGPAAAPAARGPWRARLLTFAAGMAAATLIWVFLSQRPDEVRGWRVLDGALASATVTVDGVPVSLRSAAPLEEAFASGGCRLQVTGDDVSVLHEGGFLVTLPDGTDARVVDRSEYGDSELLVLDVTAGGVHVATKDGTEGWIVVRTPDLEIELHGRAVAVDVLEGQGTCVCTLEGLARVRPRSRPSAAFVEVPGGRSYFQRRDGAGAPLDHILPDHRPALDDLARRRARWL